MHSREKMDEDHQSLHQLIILQEIERMDVADVAYSVLRIRTPENIAKTTSCRLEI